LAARALSDFAESVSIVDRDVPPDTAVPRKGVPQGRHVHGLLAGGLDALTSFFPGLLDELTAEGARTADLAQDVLWFNNGAWRLRCKCGVTGCVQTRPLLELQIRKRVAKLANIRQVSGVSATGLEMDSRKSRVTGLRIKGEGANEEILPAELVVDCSGRGSKMPAWLEVNEFEKPPVTTITVNVGYSTRFFRVPEQAELGWNALVILGQPPKGTRLGVAFLVESGELQVTMGGEFRDYPPDDDAGFLKFAESLEHPAIFQAIRNAIPASSIATYRFPAHVWNHYDWLKKFPANVLVLGDALCRFNPIYGQGMTVAALEAQVLHRCLAETKNGADRIDGLQGRYFRGVSSIVQAAWAMATGADLAYPQVEGPKPAGHAAINRYLGHVIALSCYDRKVLTAWNQVTNMQRPLSALFGPSIVARVVRRAVMGGPALNSQCPVGSDF
jgi:2-polyprenyl-6-methoxyphenol hydroxylase-like FAD-dependent oxidoreductase